MGSGTRTRKAPRRQTAGARAATADAAPVSRRVIATAIDFAPALVLMCVGVVHASVVGGEQGRNIAVVWASGLALVLLVTLICSSVMVIRSGRTPGKRLMGVRVVRTDGTERVGWERGCARELVSKGFVPIVLVGINLSLAPFVILAILLPAWFRSDRRDLSDLMSGTRVVTDTDSTARLAHALGFKL